MDIERIIEQNKILQDNIRKLMFYFENKIVRVEICETVEKNIIKQAEDIYYNLIVFLAITNKKCEDEIANKMASDIVEQINSLNNNICDIIDIVKKQIMYDKFVEKPLYITHYIDNE